MARINQYLLTKIVEKSGLSKSRVYKLISELEIERGASANQAALILASRYDIGIKRYSTEAERSQLASLKRDTPTVFVNATPQKMARRPAKKQAGNKAIDPTAVFLIHGRNADLNTSMYAFLRSIGLNPLEFSVAIQKTIKRNRTGGNPYLGDIIDVAFAQVKALIVLFSPDDEVRLREELWVKGEKADEKGIRYQPRPNVIFEAGLAIGKHQEKTIFVSVGKSKPFSDIAGRHMVFLNNTASKRRDLANRLKSMGCPTITDGDEWEKAGNFSV